MTVAIKKLKPVTPGSRGTVLVVFKGGKKKRLPNRKKLEYGRAKLNKKGSGSGRNNLGRITVRHQGSGHKTKIKNVDFKRNKDGIPATVKRLVYDANRTALIALVCYADGAWSFILAPKGLKIGDKVMSGHSAPIATGNCLPLSAIPLGTTIHNLEMKPGKGAQLIRSAGCYATLVGKDSAYAIIRMKSGEMRRIMLACRATIGVVSNDMHNLQVLGKAGRKRWKGVRPTVRGVAMNPVDHPHGGGEGRTSGGRHPVSPTGVPTKGKVTRKRKNITNVFIIKKRNAKKRRG